MINAPLFMPPPLQVGGGRRADFSDGLARLPLQANMNHLYLQDSTSLAMFQSDPQFEGAALPFWTLTFPISPVLKPWYWWSFALMEWNWAWFQHRQLLQEDFAHDVLPLAVVPVVLYVLVAAPGLRWAAARPRVRASVTSALAALDASVAPAVSPPLLLACGALGAGAAGASRVLPRLMHPTYAWCVVALYTYGALFAVCHALRLVAAHGAAPARACAVHAMRLLAPCLASGAVTAALLFSPASQWTVGAALGQRVWVCVLSLLAHSVLGSRAVVRAAAGTPLSPALSHPAAATKWTHDVTTLKPPL